MDDCIDHGKTTNVHRQGYAFIRYAGRKELGHRVAYAIYAGVPMVAIRSLDVLHSCDNPRCVNPKHLRTGTHQDNMDDKVRRGRQPRGVDIANAKLTDAQVAEIRARYRPRCKHNGARALGREFGLTHPNILAVVKGVSYRGP